jgi:hypothetical protein
MRLEYGKYYRTRDGRKIGPMRNIKGDFYEKGKSKGTDPEWKSDGTHKPSLGMTEVDDLISEWVDQEEWTIFNNKIPFGLLEEGQQQKLKEWDGPYMYHSRMKGDWHTVSGTGPGWYHEEVYRAVSKPEETVEEQVKETALKQLWELLGANNQTQAVNKLKRLMDGIERIREAANVLD